MTAQTITARSRVCQEQGHERTKIPHTHPEFAAEARTREAYRKLASWVRGVAGAPARELLVPKTSRGR